MIMSTVMHTRMTTHTGGVLQNRLLLEQISHLLREQDLEVLAPRHTPANDGGLSLGQAAVAFASTRPS